MFKHKRKTVSDTKISNTQFKVTCVDGTVMYKRGRSDIEVRLEMKRFNPYHVVSDVEEV